MTNGLRIWRAAMRPYWEFLDRIASGRQQKNLQRSFTKPVVGGWSRNSFRYYEKGRWTTVSGELMTGSTGVDWVLYRRCPMKWNDTEDPLIETEKERAFRAVGEYLDKKKVRWKFSEATAPGWK